VTKKKLLFVGCSFTAHSGFDNSNIANNHWPWLVSNHFDCYYQNAGIGGSSNEEIFYRTIENVLIQQYDLVVIMWSGLGRKWTYFSEPNLDMYTIINPGPAGLNSESEEVKSFRKLYLAHFNNLYMDLKRWLQQIICLQSFLKDKSQPYVFVKGFNNLIKDFDQITRPDGRFSNVSHAIKKIMDYHSLPDWKKLEKINDIQQLINQVDQSGFYRFRDFDFMASLVDVADDNVHPGPLTNHAMSSNLIQHIKDHNLLG